MKYFDTFTGYGGFTLGIQRAYENHICRVAGKSTEGNGEAEPLIKSPQTTAKSDERSRDLLCVICGGGTRKVQCIGFSEVNKYAIQVYEKHFNHKPYGDITQINPAELPDFDLLTGGFPCQAFSIAGKRQGFNDTRGTLFFDIARILKEKRPRNFILENVKGLLSHDNGRTFKTIITTLVELGYCVEWQVLNAKDFGVPQNRERVFIVGHFGGIPERKVFPIGEDGETSDELPRHISNTLTQRYEQAQATGTYIGESKLNAQVRALTERRTDEAKEMRRNGIVKDTRSLKKLTPREDNLANTVTTGDVKNQILTDGIRIRRLTPKECERLMSMPDGWTAEGTEGKMSDTQRYKLCGNGVVVNVVEAIVRKLYGI